MTILDGDQDVAETSVRKIWAARAVADKSSRKGGDEAERTKTLHLHHEVVLFQGVQSIGLNEDRWEFPHIGTPSEVDVLSLVRFPIPFVSVPAVTVCFGMPSVDCLVTVQDICPESFVIKLRPQSRLETIASVAWKAVGFTTFGNFSQAYAE